MLQIKIQGRGGQGAQLAGQVLATAFFYEGKHIQSFASYGGARRGTAVNAFLRVDEHPILLRCDIDRPDAILCFDPTLLNPLLLKDATPKTKILVNSSQGPESFKELGDYAISTIDARKIAQAHNLGRIVNSALMGAFAALLGAPGLENLLKAIEEMSPVKKEENVASCLEGYGAIGKREGAA
jgi:pyruvate ferredoxin oxidoreductase gamma subunit